ncbi:MAG: T9SS type A sorting domain-containing protein [Flavobacterium sp.]|uniref:T9SS type A sorting domain-containing protein n=1 Tax=Flavobacterium sp. TaxID=239 RepID=UPI002638FA1F|nr:T9SS type A sorting domain-containing protein [Flavobacterium sp.]MDD5148890.1 T9SS type A sorting domain-containing protein [Flavobacterium sp.]
MKKILKFSLVLVVAFTTMNLHAGTVDFTIGVKKEQGKIVTFALENMISTIDLSIYDAEGKLIHSEKVNSKKNINRTYDLNALPKGTYFLEVESDFKISRYIISVIGETASLSTEPTSEIYKPTFVSKEGLVWVGLFNVDKSPVNIKIFDKDDNEVYDSKEVLDQNVKKVFDINYNNSEEYTFVVTDNDRTFTKTFGKR